VPKLPVVDNRAQQRWRRRHALPDVEIERLAKHAVADITLRGNAERMARYAARAGSFAVVVVRRERLDVLNQQVAAGNPTATRVSRAARWWWNRALGAAERPRCLRCHETLSYEKLHSLVIGLPAKETEPGMCFGVCTACAEIEDPQAIGEKFFRALRMSVADEGAEPS
jgi:hypothetical protein